MHIDSVIEDNYHRIKDDISMILQSHGIGAEWGVGVGMTGQCYAIPTMDGSIDIIRKHVDDFTAYAKEHPELTFLVTRIGCGIAGWRDSEIAPLFKEASALDNVTLPEEFWNALGL